MRSPYGRPERTPVEHEGIAWTVSTIEVEGRGIESIAFEERAGGRQVYVNAPSHEEAVERFRAAIAANPLVLTHTSV